MTCLAASVIVLTAFWRPVPLLVWNASASVPTGLYAVRPIPSTCALAVEDLVIARPPGPLAAFLASRGYLPRGVPLIKHVAALPGHTVCRLGAVVSVDGLVRARARAYDYAGRVLPSWNGCRRVGRDAVFLLNADVPASLDGRYFGPFPRSSIVGRAVPIWTGKER